MRKKKILKGIGIGFILLAGLLLLALEIGARFYQDRAAAYLRAQFNRRSDLVLQPFRTSVSVWQHFPRLTFTFHQIAILDTSGRAPLPVLTIRQAQVAVPLTQFRPGRLRIGLVHLQDVLLRQKTDSTGKKISLRFRPRAETDTSGGGLAFTLPRLQIANLRIISENDYKKSAFVLQVREGRLALRSDGRVLQATGHLAGKIGHLASNKLQLFRNQPFTAQVDYDYLLPRKRGTFRQTYAHINGEKIRIRGWHQARRDGPGAQLNLTLTGSQPLMYLFRELLPPQVQPFLNRMQTQARLQAVYRITGESGPTRRPRNQLSFAVKNGTFYLPASRQYIRQVYLQGSLDNGARHAPETSRFRISHLSAGRGRHRFQLRLDISNFRRPSFAIRSRGSMDLPAVAAFVTLPFAAVSQGTVAGAFYLRGTLPDTVTQKRRDWRGEGSFQVRDAAFQPLALSVGCRDVNAQLIFTDSLLQLRDLSGTVGGYPFRLQASIRNYAAYLFSEPGFIVSQASIYARRLDLDWLQAPVLEEPAPAAPPKAPAPPAGKTPAPDNAGPGHRRTWQELQTSVSLRVAQVQIPGREQIRNLAVQIDQQGSRVALTRMRFATTRGGVALAQGGFQLIPGGITRPFLDVRVRYSFLDLQAFMQNMTAFKPKNPAGQAREPDPEQKSMGDYLEKRYWLSLQVQAQRLQYLYLRGTNLVLAASMNRHRAELARLQLQTLGGQLEAQGTMQLNTPGNTYPLRLRTQVRDINLQQLFRVAENMQVDLLSPRNIRGQADCQLVLVTQLDDTFSPAFDRTVAYTRTRFRNLELIEVAPIQQALRFLRKERLRHLYFQDVTAAFVLRHHTFIAPGFDLNSNLTDFRLGGSYTMGGSANLLLDVNVLRVLFGNNKRRIEKIKEDSTALAADSVAAPGRSRKQHLLVFRDQDKYKVRLSSRRTRQQTLRALRAAYSSLIRQYQIDTVFRNP